MVSIQVTSYLSFYNAQTVLKQACYLFCELKKNNKDLETKE